MHSLDPADRIYYSQTYVFAKTAFLPRKAPENLYLPIAIKYIWFAGKNTIALSWLVTGHPYTSRVARTDPYKVFLHAQEFYWRDFQSTDVTLKHSVTPQSTYWTPATRREQRTAAGAAAGGLTQIGFCTSGRICVGFLPMFTSSCSGRSGRDG